MELNPENIEQAVERLQAAKDEVCALLSQYPNLQMRVKHSMETLANGLAFTVNRMPQEESITAAFNQPLTHMLGMELPAVHEPMPAKVEVSNADVSELRRRASEAYETFLDRDNRALQESLSDLDQRAVAKLADMDVSETNPKRIDSAFIDQIKAAITAKREQEAAEEDEEQRIANATKTTTTTAKRK